MTDTQVLVWSAILTFVMLTAASLLRCQGWTPSGMQRAFGNRDDLPEPTALAGRADRAANNMIEGLVIFTALAAAVHFSGKGGAQSDLGATLFFWARLIYWPVYLAGIAYLRTAIWFVSIAGLVMMVLAMW